MVSLCRLRGDKEIISTVIFKVPLGCHMPKKYVVQWTAWTLSTLVKFDSFKEHAYVSFNKSAYTDMCKNDVM